MPKAKRLRRHITAQRTRPSCATTARPHRQHTHATRDAGTNLRAWQKVDQIAQRSAGATGRSVSKRPWSHTLQHRCSCVEGGWRGIKGGESVLDRAVHGPSLCGSARRMCISGHGPPPKES
eukprot:1784722-Prymnesium_polylepis.1